jgi:hypothetical protein
MDCARVCLFCCLQILAHGCMSFNFRLLKSHWIGRNYYSRGAEGNDIHQTNVPHIRIEFRHNVCTLHPCFCMFSLCKLYYLCFEIFVTGWFICELDSDK